MALETAVNDSTALGGGGGGGGAVVGGVLNMTSLTTTLSMLDSGSTNGHVDLSSIANEWTAGLVAEYSVRIVLAVLMVFVNTLVLVTLGTTPSLRSCSANLVIGSLAVTDLMMGVMSPGGMLIELQIVVLPLLCRIGYAGVMALSSVSINHLLFVSVDRYLQICRPLRYSSFITKRRVWIFIAFCWVWAVAVSVPFLFGLSIQPDWDGQCLAELMIPLWLIVLLTVLHFVLPLLIMLYVYVAIFVVARRQQKAVKDSFRINDVEPNNGVSRGNRAKLRAARLLALPCGFFYLSWGPWFGVMLWAIITDSVVQPHGLERFVQTLCILNSLGNPILYAVSQPVLGRAMVAKVASLTQSCRRRCLAAYKRKHMEATTLMPPEVTVDSTCV